MPGRLGKRIRSTSNLKPDDEEDSRVRLHQKFSDKTASDVSLRKVRKHLQRHKVLTHSRKDFIPLPAIKKFWTVECPIETFLEEIHCLSPASAQNILKVSIRVFTALLLVDWDSDDRFRQILQEKFSGNVSQTWTDDSLIGTDFSRLGLSGLSRDELNDFGSATEKVSVPVLGKDSKHFHRNTTLPITVRDEIGKGAFGKVYAIKIAEGCLMVDNTSGTKSPNKAEDDFALKKMNISESQSELDFLREYRQMSRHSDHIVDHFAIVERGNEASVIYPLALGDLQKLLEGELKSFPWHSQDATQFRDIVGKCYDLADGLEFLHNDLRNRSRFVCRHGDLKPNNFLIFLSGWKISDMGLARVKVASDNESGVRKTTKTSLKEGCGAYAAPEMSGPEGTPVGRQTDVWSLAAIIMEIIIWGFGGPSAWRAFVCSREQGSKGLFHKDGTLSQAVDEELCSWPHKYSKTASMFLKGDEMGALRFLEDLVGALRGALIVDPEKRVDCNRFLDSMDKAYRHFKKPIGEKEGITTSKRLELRDIPTIGKQGRAMSNRLEIRSSASDIAWQALQRKFREHRQSDIFSHFTPKEDIRVSNETEDRLKKWIQQSTPSALCILKNEGDGWLPVSAITHEVYYTARSKGYDVIEFLTLDRYDHTATSSWQASLDCVYCFVFQLLKYKLKDQLKEYHLEKLAIEDSRLSCAVKFESAVDTLGQIINTLHGNRSSRPIIFIIDEFWRVCSRTQLDATRRQWEKLLALLGCATPNKMSSKSDTGPLSVVPNFKVLIRANGWLKELQALGFDGDWCIPSTRKQHSAPTLRTTLEGLFEKAV